MATPADLLNSQGIALAQAGKLAEARAVFEQSLRQLPTNAAVHNNLGIVLCQQGRLNEGITAYRQAILHDPRHAEAHYNLGKALTAQGKPDEALPCYEEALRIQPDYADALNNLGNLYKDQRRIDEALACYRRAVAARPGRLWLHSGVLFAQHCSATYDPEATFAEHVRWGARFDPPPAPPPTDRDPGRRLRIGYVSGDFREHVMGRYAQAVIAAHDRSRFEVFGYAQVAEPDALTQRIRASADHWCSLTGLTDAQAVERIRQDRIDLLIDLAGHTGGNRLGVFARKAAPVQVTHCGYAATTGLKAVDFRLTDAHCDPPGRTEQLHTETIRRLPQVHWCYEAPADRPEAGPLPALQTGALTFGCFNNLHKVTDAMIALWAQILAQLPGSRILLLTGASLSADEGVWSAFAAQGIERPRVILIKRLGRPEYFRLYQGVDLCLDTYPYAGCNTTADAVWMGVPVINLAGPTCVSRLGVSVLVHAGLGYLVTETAAAYVEAAVALARDLPRLAELRAQLRPRLEQSPLMDVPGFTRVLEAAYRGMWEQFCRRG